MRVFGYGHEAWNFVAAYVQDIDVNSWDSSFFQTVPMFTRLQVID
jgi:hypothetical protein